MNYEYTNFCSRVKCINMHSVHKHELMAYTVWY